METLPYDEAHDSASAQPRHTKGSVCGVVGLTVGDSNKGRRRWRPVVELEAVQAGVYGGGLAPTVAATSMLGLGVWVGTHRQWL
jgi:hypothetical protein